MIKQDINNIVSVDVLLKKFKKEVLRDGILLEYKKHQYFKSKAVKRKEKSIEAKKRQKNKKKRY